MVDASARVVILDLSGLAFIDSAGLRAIDRANGTMAADGRMLLVVAPESSRAAWTFRIAGFADDSFLDSLDAARLQAGT
jgi:anti-anti-sigma regulatory factor